LPYVTPTLKREVIDQIEEVNRLAKRFARTQFGLHGEPPPDLPERSPYTVADLLADDFALRPQPKPPGA
jgi:hypothetical protein